MNHCQGCAKSTHATCSDRHDPDHCPRHAFVPAEPHYAVRFYRPSAHQLEQADEEEA